MDGARNHHKILFFRLKKFLQTIPSKRQFTDLTGTDTTADFIKVLDSDYDKLLEVVSLKGVKTSDQSEHVKKMKSLILEKMQGFDKNKGKEKTLIYIDNHLDPNDELSVLIHAYCSNKKELKKLLYSD